MHKSIVCAGPAAIDAVPPSRWPHQLLAEPQYAMTCNMYSCTRKGRTVKSQAKIKQKLSSADLSLGLLR